MNRSDRLTGILLALQGGRKTARQLSDRFEVSRRTILRDIDALSQIGVPVVALTGAGGGYEVAAGFWLPPMQFTVDEASLLLIALKGLGPAEGSPFGKGRLTVEEKLRALLSTQILHDAEQAAGAIAIQQPHRAERLHHLAALRRAVAKGQWLRMRYQSLRHEAEHLVLPLRLFVEGGRWYCAALSYERRAERLFRVDRILDLAPCSPPADAEHLIESLARLDHAVSIDEKVRIVAHVSYAALRKLEDHPDFARHLSEGGEEGSLNFVSPVSQLDYFARELFALGPEVTVLEPSAVRDKILALARATASRYAGLNGDGTVSPSRE